jgi:dihydrofolate synthase/folylpolyglutamate synthase
MDFQQALDYLYSRLPIFQRQGKAALKPDLSNTRKLLEALDQPQNLFKSVHIAGTNGKGTSAHALASVFQAAGYRTGLYTSPHLKNFTERIRLDGKEISADFVADFVSRMLAAIEEIKPSFFEVTVALAFDFFAREKVDLAVVETGLGGRLDSTNVLEPEVCLITSIGYDHMDLLGDTLPQIAGEKAGIIKSGTPVVIGAHQPDIASVFTEKAAAMSAPIQLNAGQFQIRKENNSVFHIFRDGNPWLSNISRDLPADYFLLNVPGIVMTLESLIQQGWQINRTHIKSGLENIRHHTGLKGRYQVLREKPKVIADVSHNEPGLSGLFDQILKEPHRSLFLIYGTVADKDLGNIIPLLPQAYYCWTEAQVPRKLPATQLQKRMNEQGKEGLTFANVNEALAHCLKLAGEEDLILITGSTFVVAEIENL